MIEIREFKSDDWSATWRFLEPVFRAGKTYAYPTNISEAEARALWTHVPTATFVAIDVGTIVGTYFIKPNQTGHGDHVCNCGYVVAEAARGRGVASEMCAHSQQEAVRHGFRAMQYNLVVSTNERALRLWKRHGFDIVGTLPRAFRHPALGFVDAYVMFKDFTAAQE